MADTKEYKEIVISVKVDSTDIDAAIEKANRLVELLREASALIDSLAARSELEA